ncbi:MAG: TIGR04283 family arsenosugar biosynthesis glycosyltransferase [Proteobacteria bacterium]|nr:TIGR04283 family arsenosugar biosynthesis glycosyltransferase [Pseudomonadota bacterium]
MDSTRQARLILFTRYPEPGRTKTRLIPALGAQGAAALQRRMSEAIVIHMTEFAAQHPVVPEIRYADGSQQAMETWLSSNIPCRPQGEGDLGDRLCRAFAHAFAQGDRQVVIIGADCPTLTPALFAQAFAALNHKDLVIGPAMDGGYYLVGLSRPTPSLFSDIPWGSGEVLPATLKQAEGMALGTHILETLADVDRPEDLRHFIPVQQQLENRLKQPGCYDISIIIPTLNEAACIGQTVAELVEQPGVEVIVSDGGSSDQTVTLATVAGARVIQAPLGRGNQQNVGAQAAQGRVLLFLHADTRLPEGFVPEICETLDKQGIVAGTFRFGVDATGWRFRLLEQFTNWRASWFGLPYGDQGLFLAAARFQAMGGFREIPLLEDLDLVLRLRKKGRLALLTTPALTSSRRWQRLGFVRTTVVNQMILLGFFFGISPDRLARWYGRGQENNGRFSGK